MIEYRLHVIGKYLSRHNPDLGEMVLPRLLSNRKADRDKAIRSRELSGLREALEEPLLDPIALAVSDILGQPYGEARLGLLRDLRSELLAMRGKSDRKITAAYSFEPFLATWMALHAAKKSMEIVQGSYIDKMVDSPEAGAPSAEYAAHIRDQLPSFIGTVDRYLSFFGTFKMNLRVARSDLDLYINATARVPFREVAVGWLPQFSWSLADAARNALSAMGNLQDNLNDPRTFLFCYQPDEAPLADRKNAMKGCRVAAVSEMIRGSERLVEAADLCVSAGAWRTSKSAHSDWYDSQHRALWKAAVDSIEAYPPTLARLSSGSVSSPGSAVAALIGGIIGGGAVFAASKNRL
jgi:hypothetical protein